MPNTLQVDLTVKPYARPFVKWAGGKRSILRKLLDCVPDKIQDYYEPFVGGGAMFFALRSRLKHDIYLSDRNNELMITYKTIATQRTKLIKILENHQSLHDKDYYTSVKNRKVNSNLEKAARFIYLNKTCFNGLYRVNRNQQFNVPMGKYINPKILDDSNLKAVSKVLKGVILTCQPFENIQPKKDDFIYCDPPYDKTYNSYTEHGFDDDDQQRLAKIATEWHKKKVSVMLSNSDTEMIRRCYEDKHWKFHKIMAPRYINCKGDGRNKKAEVVITNYG